MVLMVDIMEYFFNPDFGYNDFMRIMNWMPYVIELDLKNDELVFIKEHCYIGK